MVPLVASPPIEKTDQTNGRQTAKGKRRGRPAGKEEAASENRFFLPESGSNGSAPELGREVSSDGEARVEAFKLGVTYYSLQEWRPVADLAGKNPALKREAVPRRGTTSQSG